MIFNDVDLTDKYGIILMSKGLDTADKEINYIWPVDSLEPLRLKETKTEYATFKPKILVEGADRTDLEEKISNILAECQSGVLKFSDLDFIYDVELNASSPKYICKIACELTLEFQVNCKYSSEKTETKSGVTALTINNGGNTDTYCNVEITPTISYVDLVITGLTNEPFTINNIEANKTIKINRESGITIDGTNKFNDLEDFWEFPRLKKGTNNISLSRENINIKIIYKERYI